MACLARVILRTWHFAGWNSICYFLSHSPSFCRSFSHLTRWLGIPQCRLWRVWLWLSTVQGCRLYRTGRGMVQAQITEACLSSKCLHMTFTIQDHCLLPVHQELLYPHVGLPLYSVEMQLYDKSVVVNFVKCFGEVHDKHVSLTSFLICEVLTMSPINSISWVSHDLMLQKPCWKR